MNGKDFPDAGNSLYDLIVERMHDNERITIDLDGISSLPSMFLNVSIGRYMDEFGVESLRNKIGFVKITKAQAERIKEYIDKYVRK